MAPLLYLAQVWVLRSFITDDAYISLRYARNFADGFGPVWNPGGPTVEGFSNPLLVLIEAAIFAVGIDAVVAARVLGVVAGLVLLAACWWWGRRIVGEWGAAVGAVLIAATPGLAYWSVGGLETLPMALVMTAAALILARRDGGSAPAAGLLLALLPWIRPEGLGLAAALVFFSEIGGLWDRARRMATLRRLLWLALVPLLSQVLLQVVRWALYGNVVPNSVIYKTGTGGFGVVTARFLVEYGIYVVLGVVGWFRLEGRARLLVVPAAVYLVASVTFLNSVNQFSRLLLPTLPLWALLAGAALPSPGRDRGWRRAAGVAVVPVIAVLMIAVMPASLPTAYATGARYMGCRHLARYEAAQWLQPRLESGDVWAVADAGLVPFYADGTVSDMFWLNEPVLQERGQARPRVKARRVLGLEPRFFVLSSEHERTLQPHYAVERAVRRSDRFDDYELRAVTGPATYDRLGRGGFSTIGCDYFMHIFEDTGS